MTGDINDAQVLTAGQVYVGKPQLDRDAPFFFLFQAVRVDACDRFHEGGLAVVDVPGGAQDDLFQRFTLLMAFYAERPAALFFGTSMESRSPVAVSAARAIPFVQGLVLGGRMRRSATLPLPEILEHISQPHQKDR